MSYILSINRDNDSVEEARENWSAYEAYLRKHESVAPRSAFRIAMSDWWYRFDAAEGPHDSRLLAFRMGDYGASSWSHQQLSWIEIELQSAHTGTILLRYPKVFRYQLNMTADSQEIHGDWRYDEFSLTGEGYLRHTIEWADGAVWVIDASDLEHSYTP